MRLLLALLLLAWGGAARAQPGGAPHIAASLVAESAAPRAGATTEVAFLMQPQPGGWHGYWRNPGDAGFATRVTWHAPAGVAVADLRYPVPEPLLIGGLMNYVYPHDFALLATVSVPAGLKPGTAIPLAARLDWLACNPSICVPEHAELSVPLVVGDGRVAPAAAARFAAWRRALPQPLGVPARYQVADGALRLAVPLPAGAATDAPWFFPDADAIRYAQPERVVRDGDRLVVLAGAGAAAHGRVTGVLRLGPGRGLSLAALPGPVPLPATDPSATTPIGSDAGWGATLLALAGAVAGGLLLNVMPCVFPILSLKALSLARAGGGQERAARAEALAYTAGAIAVCVGLGLAILLLRAGGGLAGWAFQLQDPRVIAALLLLVLAIGLNLAGLFELPVLAGGGGLAARGGAGGAFWTGALAAFVATPCAGPFLGTALGAALLLPAAAALAVFAGLGLGLALPFLLIGFVPALRRRLPRPGAWMDALRRLLAVPMLLTALGLAWVLGRQAGVDGMTQGLAAALALALGLWAWGRVQPQARGWWRGVAGLAVAVPLVAAVAPAAPVTAPAIAGAAQPFSDTRLASLRAAGRPVFLYFTADWCLSCKVNEAAAIDRAEVRNAFALHHVAVMAGDWTRGDPAISRFLARHGRSGVPFYLFFPANGGAPRELPQLLTPGLLAGLA